MVKFFIYKIYLNKVDFRNRERDCSGCHKEDRLMKIIKIKDLDINYLETKRGF